jgi:hypothetical protein
VGGAPRAVGAERPAERGISDRPFESGGDRAYVKRVDHQRGLGDDLG